MFRKSLSVLLCAALILSTAAAAPFSSYATADAVETGSVKEAYYAYGRDPDAFVYSDDLFRIDPREYNEQLATLSFVAALASLKSRVGDGDTEENQSRNLRAYLEDNGFTDFDTNQDYREETKPTTACVACAHKKITDGGKTYTLLALFPRSGTYAFEWEYSLTESSSADDKGDFAGFRYRRDRILEYVREYISLYGLQGDIKVWTSGYSGGAGVDNLIAASLVSDPDALGGSVSLDKDDIYCYTFGTPSVGSVLNDCKNHKYDCIHNIYEDADIVVQLPPDGSGFERYGQDHFYYDPDGLDSALEMMRINDESYYEEYINDVGPELYRPYKINIEGLLNGKLDFSEDEDSYLPSEMSAYVHSVSDTILKIKKDASSSGSNSREGYFNTYQGPVSRFVTAVMNKQIPMDEFMRGTGLVPMLLSMYVMVLVEKAQDVRSEKLNSVIEGSFNQLAYFVEDKDGNLRPEYRVIRISYNAVKNTLFRINEEAAEDANGIPQRYVLNRKIQTGKAVTKLAKNLSSRMYSKTIRDMMEATETDEAQIRQVADKDADAMSYMVAHVALDNVLQSGAVEPLSFDNEQFKQLATLAGNYDRLELPHDNRVIMAWLRSCDYLYDDYSLPTAAQTAGYRRVYINASDITNVNANVIDENGDTAAEIVNGSLVSRSDDWIGITTSDNGGWLRLPLEKSYKVIVKTGGSSSVNLGVADYSVYDAKEMRLVTGDKNGSWSGIKARTVDELILDIPGVSEADDGSYDITSAAYTLEIIKGKIPVVVSSSVPAVKNVKAKAAKKSFKVSWTKLSAAKRSKVDKIEVQYSTKKTFKASATVSKKLAKTRKSIKVKGLKKGNIYYARVRTIKYTDDATYVSKWSSVKKIKV